MFADFFFVWLALKAEC